MIDIWETIKGVGGIVGLLTGGFVIWDRMVKSAPTMIVRGRPLLPGAEERWPMLDVTNKADRPVIVKWMNGERSSSFGLAKDNSIRSIVESLASGETVVSLDVGESLQIEMFFPTDLKDIDDENQIDVELCWGFAQPVLYNRFIKRRVTITKRNLRALLGPNSRLDDD